MSKAKGKFDDTESVSRGKSLMDFSKPPKIIIRMLNWTENGISSVAKKALNCFNLTSYTREFSFKNGQSTIA